MILPSRPDPAQPLAIDVLARLPLAEAFYSLWRYLAAEEVLQPLFQQYRGDCHEQQLSFTELVHVVADALTRYHGSGRQAIVAALKEQLLRVCERTLPIEAVRG